jgi:protein involved in polysaccharide export with SLBB domain
MLRFSPLLRLGHTYFFALLIAAFSLCMTPHDAFGATAAPAAAAQANPVVGYSLGAGDKLRVIVFGEMDLSGDYQVDGSGFVRLPLIGEVKAAGLSVHDFEVQVKSKLEEGYLKDARVSVEITSYRPFYIIGEVNKPGEYAYVNDMNALNAVALAGGFTYRANKDEVYIRREGSTKEEKFESDRPIKVNPGDILRIPERFF